MFYKTLLLISVLLFSGCSSYRTVYKIETTDGDRIYSDDEPDLDESKGIYEVEDLDGNEYQIKESLIYKVEKYKYKK